MEILGISHIAMAVIIAVAGTAIYHLRNWPEGTFDIRKIVDSRIAIFGTSVTAAYAALPTIVAQAPTPDLQLLAVLGQIGAIAGIGFGAKKINDKRNGRKADKQAQTLTQMRAYGTPAAAEQKHDKGPGPLQLAAAPVLGPPDSWFQTNLKNQKGKGAVLPYGSAYLWLCVKDAKTFVSATLADGAGNFIQAQQSHEHDEDKKVDTVRFAMFDKTGTPLPRGIYEVKVAGDRGTSYSIGTGTKFEIV